MLSKYLLNFIIANSLFIFTAPFHFVSQRRYSRYVASLQIFRNSHDKQIKPSSFDSNSYSSDLNDNERLQKVIARAGLASRRGAESMILDGRVQVNGKIVTELGVKVRPNVDIILVDGAKVSLPDSAKSGGESAYHWIALNKPRATLTTMEDEKGRSTILDIVPRARDLRLVPIGRMERDSTGLILMTNDVGWIHPLTHPSYQHIRRYEVVVSGIPNENSLKLLRDGGAILTDDNGGTSKCKPAQVAVLDVDPRAGLALVDLLIEESRPLQIQRMMELIGHSVVSIKRTEFGPIALKGLRRAEWRELTKMEVDRLKQSCVKLDNDVREDENIPSRSGSRRGRRIVKKIIRRPGAGYAARQAFIQSKEAEQENPSVRQQRDRKAA